MMEYKKFLPVLFLVLSNLVPLVGVLWADWNALVIILLYWTENIIIGIYYILKMFVAKMVQPPNSRGTVFTILFFCLHYGAFCAVHGYFILNFFEIDINAVPTTDIPESANLTFIQPFFSFIHNIWATMPDGIIWPLLALFVSHGVSFAYNYILAGEYKDATIKKLMKQPYKRIVVMHVTILAAAIFITKYNSPLPMLVILVIIKISMDIKLHNKEHGLYLFKNKKIENHE